MHSEAARQKRFQPRACWYIFDMIVVASTFFVHQLCACVMTSQVQERTTCMDLDCLVERTSIFKGPCGYPLWPSSGSQARKRTYATVVRLVMLIQMGRCYICMFMGAVLRVVCLRSAIHVSTCWCTCWLCN